MDGTGYDRISEVAPEVAAITNNDVRQHLFYRRATPPAAAVERLSAENISLLEASRDDAVTDPLTGLR